MTSKISDEKREDLPTEISTQKGLKTLYNQIKV